MNINTKTYFKVMSILMLVFGILWCCTLIGLIWGIPILIGAGNFKKAQNFNQAELKENNTTLLVWAIIFGIFTAPAGVVAVVFAVFVYNMIEEGNSEKTIIIDVKAEAEKRTKADEIQTELETLEALKKNGIITETEYQEKRKKILDL